jgi:hypothetical protein
MTDILNKTIVLVLNRNWQAINIRTPADAFCQMATNVATALEIDGVNDIRPIAWDEWITLPIRDGDNAVHTVRGAIRVPTVIVAVNFAKVPKKAHHRHRHARGVAPDSMQRVSSRRSSLAPHRLTNFPP